MLVIMVTVANSFSSWSKSHSLKRICADALTVFRVVEVESKLSAKDIEMATLTQSVHDLEAAAAHQAASVDALQARNEAAVASWRSKLVRRAPPKMAPNNPP
eukprot:COSAG04_NODE_6218_length_1381_cov_2.324493_2_plen_102_part_00